MSINPTVVRNSSGGWNFAWPVGTAPYSLWLNGRLLETTSDEEYTYNDPGYEDAPPPIEIVNDGETSEGSLYPAFIILQWYGIPTAIAYIVEKYVSGSWSIIGTRMEESKGYYTWTSRILDDGANEQFRVKAVNHLGEGGTPLTFSHIMVRNPAPPVVDIEISSGGDIVVIEA